MPCVAGRIRIGMSKDNVNHPSHYEAGPFECIELTRLYPFAGGNAIKYVFRHRAKNGVEDLEKALWYLDHATADELRPMPSFCVRVHRPSGRWGITRLTPALKGGACAANLVTRRPFFGDA